MTIMQVSRRLSISYEKIYNLLAEVKLMPRMAKKRLGRLRNKRDKYPLCSEITAADFYS